MPAEQWQQVTKLFNQVLTLPEAERAVFLDDQCGKSGDLRDQVAALLVADAEAGAHSFLEKHLEGTPPDLAAADNRPAEPLPGEGDRLGPYRLLREIGRGGMGIVYLASRDDEAFERRVAIKLIRQGRASDDAMRRMRLERQILASLEHPGIATLHDGGTTSEGLPYFVMEHVDGVRIDAYCKQQQNSLEARIELFLEVCSAVEFAHRNLIVHRDLKPSNILVTSDGVPKLLDFGVAKLLNPNLARGDIEATEAWMRVLTPGYASPEQVRGAPVTTASDVYSLGVLLFKLITGRLPFPIEDEFLIRDDRLTKRQAPLASQVVKNSGDSERFAAKLGGDLDSILAKALHESSEQRYGTVARLAEDLRRYQNHLPVTARRGNFRYQAGKFLRRHAMGVGVFGVFLALVLGFGVAMFLQNHQIRQERDTKTAVINYFVEIFESADAFLHPGEQLSVRQVLQHGEELQGQFELEPSVKATLAEVIGKVYLGLGESDLARRRFEQAFNAQTRLHGEQSLEAAKALSLMGSATRRNKKEAIELGESAVTIARAAVGDYSPELVEPLNRLVSSFCYWSDYESVSLISEEALALARRWFGERTAVVGVALANQAAVLRSQNQLAEAGELYQQVLEIQHQNLPEKHPRIADTWSNIAGLESKLNHLEKSEQIYKEVLRMQRAAFDGIHADMAQTLTNLSSVLLKMGRRDESVERFQEAVNILSTTRGKDFPRTISLEIHLARRLTKVCRAAEARSILEQGLPYWRSLEFTEKEKIITKATDSLAEAIAAKGCNPEKS